MFCVACKILPWKHRAVYCAAGHVGHRAAGVARSEHQSTSYNILILYNIIYITYRGAGHVGDRAAGVARHAAAARLRHVVAAPPQVRATRADHILYILHYIICKPWRGRKRFNLVYMFCRAYVCVCARAPRARVRAACVRNGCYFACV